jgi:hypothetical protein
MNTGMLWFDNDPRTDFDSKVKKAAEYFSKKYGLKPDLCFVHPSMLSSIPPSAAGLEVRTNKLVLPHHFWLGSQALQG